jgi:hypothetical protein
LIAKRASHNNIFPVVAIWGSGVTALIKEFFSSITIDVIHHNWERSIEKLLSFIWQAVEVGPAYCTYPWRNRVAKNFSCFHVE